MANLEKVVKVTQSQYDTLASGGTVGSYTGLDDNYIYLIEDTNEYITSAGGTLIDGNSGIRVNDSSNHYIVGFCTDWYGGEIIYNNSNYYKPLFTTEDSALIYSEDGDYLSDFTFNTCNFKIYDGTDTDNSITISPENGCIFYYSSSEDTTFELYLPCTDGEIATTDWVYANPGSTSQTLSSIHIGGVNYAIQGGVTDVQINGTSILSNTVANIVTKTAYNSSTNKIATQADLPQVFNYLSTPQPGGPAA